MSHALLAPSASHRWIACPPSARLTEFLADTESSYAAEGTLAHSVAEENLTTGSDEPKPLRLAMMRRWMNTHPITLISQWSRPMGYKTQKHI